MSIPLIRRRISDNSFISTDSELDLPDQPISTSPTSPTSPTNTQYTNLRWLQPTKRWYNRIANILKPRLTVKYILAAAAALYVGYCFLTWSPFFADRLPPFTGPYGVGTVDVEVKSEKGRISDVVFREGGKPAFEMDTVLFSIFYPTEKGAKSLVAKHPWISKPLANTAEGYLRLGRVNNFVLNGLTSLVLWGLVGGIKIPAQVDVSILSSPKLDESKRIDGYEVTKPPYPVVVFSHGFASSRTDYTQYCSELAARGIIVAAIEHRDGSSPGSVIFDENGWYKPVWPVSTSDLQISSTNSTVLTNEDLKHHQLTFRQAEIEETIRVLRSLNNGDGDSIHTQNRRKEGKSLAGFKDLLDFDKIVMAGHSYGATGALQALLRGPSPSLPFCGGIALDPGKSSGPLNHNITLPLLIIHSNSWSSHTSIFYGRPHFDVVKEIAEGVLKKGIPSWFLTSLGTSHPSVTDAPLIEPLLLSATTGSRIEVKEGVREYFRVTGEFVEVLRGGRRRGVLNEEVTHTLYNVVDEKRIGKLDEELARYWEVHVAPKVG